MLDRRAFPQAIEGCPRASANALHVTCRYLVEPRASSVPIAAEITGVGAPDSLQAANKDGNGSGG
jgi:hypothetical protein